MDASKYELEFGRTIDYLELNSLSKAANQRTLRTRRKPRNS